MSEQDKLSNRIRPDCEAAPWVAKEVKELEAELAAANSIIAQLTETITAAIESGDWKVDGANDPDSILKMARRHLEGK